MSQLARIETVVFLRTVDIFSHCKAEEVLRIASIAREREFKASEKIYDRNEPADTLYCVVRGGVTLEGSQESRRQVGPLHTFGVEEILSGRLRTSRAVSDADTLVLAIDAEDFFDLLANNIEIVKALFRYVLQDQGQHPH